MSHPESALVVVGTVDRGYVADAPGYVRYSVATPGLLEVVGVVASAGTETGNPAGSEVSSALDGEEGKNNG